MGTRCNSKHDDETWRALFRRWHAGEDSRALKAEAGVSHDTWSANAKRLGMRIRDLAPDDPARRRTPTHAERADDWRHPNSLLREGEWRALFVMRAEGVPDTALCARFGVKAATICSQAKARGVTRAQVRAAVEALPSPSHPVASRSPSPDGEGEASVLAGVEIVMGDAGRTMASFDGAIAEAGRRADYVTVTTACRAKLSVRRAMFGEGSPSPSHPVAVGDDPPLDGEGEAAAVWADPVLRTAQRAPARGADGGDWTTWLFLGGRGAGKTLAGAMWLADQAEALGDGGRLALIGPTLHDVREVMIEGASGILTLPRWRDPKWRGARPTYEPSRRRLAFPNGAVAHAFSAEDPDSLRGPQFSAAWADEFCAWRGREGAGSTLALLRMGLRLPGPPRCLSGAAVVGPSGPPDPTRPGAARRLTPADGARDRAQAASDRVPSGSPPRLMISTTPRPTAALRRLRLEPGVVETHAGTRDNAAHLSAGFVEGLERLYGGTRRAAQEIEGRVVENAGALFTAEMMIRARWASSSSGGGGQAAQRPGGRGGASGPETAAAWPSPSHPVACGDDPPLEGEGEASALPAFDRVVVAVDPTATAGGDACGIVAAGRRGEEVWVLADRSMAGVSPDAWARRVARTAEEVGAACVVAEVNQGGDMVRALLKASGCAVRVREVRATKGKRVRAEPVAALYEQGRVRHAAPLEALEDELMALGGEDEGSLDRADALVWAVTDLMIDRAGDVGEGPRIRSFDVPTGPPGLTGLWR